jgi:hypothetical protein
MMKFRMTYDRYTRHEADSFFQEPGEQVCHYRLHGGMSMHSQDKPMTWKNSAGRRFRAPRCGGGVNVRDGGVTRGVVVGH